MNIKQHEYEQRKLNTRNIKTTRNKISNGKTLIDYHNHMLLTKNKSLGIHNIHNIFL